MRNDQNPKKRTSSGNRYGQLPKQEPFNVEFRNPYENQNPGSARHAQGQRTAPQRSYAQRSARQNASSQQTYRHASRQQGSVYPQREERSYEKAFQESPLWTDDNQNIIAGQSDKTHSKGVLASIGVGIASLFSVFFKFLGKNKILRAVVCVLLVLAVVGLIDGIMNHDRIYPGVKVGELDVGGMKSAEAKEAIESAYGHALSSKTVTIYAEQETQDAVDSGEYTEEGLLALLDAMICKYDPSYWTITSEKMDVSIPSDDIVKDALAVGRDNGWLVNRIVAATNGYTVEPYLAFSEGALDTLVSEINAEEGDRRVDFDIGIEDGEAYIIEGEDGKLVSKEALKAQLTKVFLDPDAEYDIRDITVRKDPSLTEEYVLGQEYHGTSILARIDYAPCRTTLEQAQAVQETVNQALSRDMVFRYQDYAWNESASTVGSWVSTYVKEENGEYELIPYVKESRANQGFIESLKNYAEMPKIPITFSKGDDGVVAVHAQVESKMPLIIDAIADLDKQLFGSKNASGGVDVTIEAVDIPDALSLEDAMTAGLVSEISTYTTEYSNGSSKADRNFNIHHAADLLNDSIVPANGGVWSFNETTGESNEENGFRHAGTILEGEYVDDVGGGICQVATTVFNAVYESGFPVLRRYNHTLYIASYPAGRDAAVSWPDLDLRWENDTDSDVLLRMSYTDTTVTCTLYGVNPEYVVESDVGDWEDGKKYSYTFKTDEEKSSSYCMLESTGTDASSITVVRTVTSKDGEVLHVDYFESDYQPKNAIYVVGPGYDTAALKADLDARRAASEGSGE